MIRFLTDENFNGHVIGAFPMAGLVKVPQELRMTDVLYDLGIIDQCSSQDEWEGRVFHLPI